MIKFRDKRDRLLLQILRIDTDKRDRLLPTDIACLFLSRYNQWNNSVLCMINSTLSSPNHLITWSLFHPQPSKINILYVASVHQYIHFSTAKTKVLDGMSSDVHVQVLNLWKYIWRRLTSWCLRFACLICANGLQLVQEYPTGSWNTTRSMFSG